MRNAFYRSATCIIVLTLLLAGMGAAVPCAYAALVFPALTGRVVDQAGLLSAGAEATLAGQLESHEQGTGRQLVVVTVTSLQGSSIEDYGYQLGRNWGIGEKDKNTGALLLIAPNERRVRIEVGYGLEGVLTDALSHQIIQGVILPRFKDGDYEQGIIQGAGAIMKVLSGTYKPVKQASSKKRGSSGFAPVLIFLVIMSVILNARRQAAMGRGSRRVGGGGFWAGGIGGGLGGGGFGGGFSGGGGSFGGGGASGSW
jgi:uncharacterized protein